MRRVVRTCAAIMALGLLLLGARQEENLVRASAAVEPVEVPEAMLRELPEGSRPFFIWDQAAEGNANRAEPSDLAEAVEVSGRWIRAVFQEAYVPDDIEKQIIGFVDYINGYDVTRVEFQTGDFRFLVTQKASTIYVLIVPLRDGTGGVGRSPADLRVYLRATIEKVFRHAAVILYLQRMEETGFGVRMVMDERAGHEEGYGLPADTEEEVRAPEWPSQTEESRKSFELRDAKVRELDSTLPEEFQRHGGARRYWWGRVYAATDGHVVVFISRKGRIGPARKSPRVLKDWFRKEKLSHPRLKSYGAPMPPKDAPTRIDE